MCLLDCLAVRRTVYSPDSLASAAYPVKVQHLSRVWWCNKTAFYLFYQKTQTPWWCSTVRRIHTVWNHNNVNRESWDSAPCDYIVKKPYWSTGQRIRYWTIALWMQATFFIIDSVIADSTKGHCGVDTSSRCLSNDNPLCPVNLSCRSFAYIEVLI